MRQVDVAARNIRLHNIRSEIETHHADAVANWSLIVAKAKESSVIFNCIDFGTMFDAAVSGLSKALAKPLVQGQSYGWFFNTELYSGKPGLVCGSCNNRFLSSFGDKSQVTKPVFGMAQRLQNWMEVLFLIRSFDSISSLFISSGIMFILAPVCAQAQGIAAKVNADAMLLFLSQAIIIIIIFIIIFRVRGD
jgi:hypothetical protein